MYEARPMNSEKGIAAPDPQSFLDNLGNLRLVLSVALEHVQRNREQFACNATSQQIKEGEECITTLRGLANQFESELKLVESLVFQRRRALT
jgi:hypothetical protein